MKKERDRRSASSARLAAPGRQPAARGVTTAYGYNGAGDLETVDYSDDTPGI